MPMATTQTIVAVPHISITLLEQIIMILPLYILPSGERMALA